LSANSVTGLFFVADLSTGQQKTRFGFRLGGSGKTPIYTETLLDPLPPFFTHWKCIRNYTELIGTRKGGTGHRTI
jgi:hypothetical protein